MNLLPIQSVTERNTAMAPTMNFQAVRTTRPALPQLSTTTVNEWLFAVCTTAKAMRIEDIFEDIGHIHGSARHKQGALPASAINASLPNRLPSTIYSTNIYTNIAIFINRVRQKLSFSSRATLISLVAETETTQECSYLNMDDYLKAHDELRAEMVSANFPSINDEYISSNSL